MLCAWGSCGAGASPVEISFIFNWKISLGITRVLLIIPAAKRAGVRAHDPSQPEKDVPHPHDFEAFGLTKTKPCCISVS